MKYLHFTFKREATIQVALHFGFLGVGIVHRDVPLRPYRKIELSADRDIIGICGGSLYHLPPSLCYGRGGRSCAMSKDFHSIFENGSLIGLEALKTIHGIVIQESFAKIIVLGLKMVGKCCKYRYLFVPRGSWDKMGQE